MDPGERPLLDHAFDSFPDAVVVFDRERRIRASNVAARTITGLDEGSTTGKRLLELLERPGYLAENAATFTILDAVVGEVMERGEEHHDDDASRRGPDGTTIPVSLRLTPIWDDGEVVGAVFIAGTSGSRAA